MERPWQDTMFFFLRNAMLYLLVVGVSVAIRMTGQWYRAENIRKDLERSRSEAELQNLKSQLNPHSYSTRSTTSIRSSSSIPTGPSKRCTT